MTKFTIIIQNNPPVNPFVYTTKKTVNSPIRMRLSPFSGHLFLQPQPDLANTFPKARKIMVIEDEVIGLLGLFLRGQLGIYTPLDFFDRKAQMLLKPLAPEILWSLYHDQLVHQDQGPTLHQQGRVHHHDAPKARLAKLRQKLVQPSQDGGVKNLVKAISTPLIPEGSPAQLSTIERTISLQDPRSKDLNQFLEDLRLILHNLTSYLVCIDDPSPQLGHHLADNGFSSAYAAGHADDQHVETP
jgi:hypothetical protein